MHKGGTNDPLEMQLEDKSSEDYPLPLDLYITHLIIRSQVSCYLLREAIFLTTDTSQPSNSCFLFQAQVAYPSPL